MIDYFTNWVEAAPMKTLKSEEAADVFYKEIITRHGVRPLDRTVMFLKFCCSIKS